MRLRKLGLAWVLASTACMTAGQHKAAVQDDTADKLTVGKVQREIRVGMSGADVIQVLGSPNVVTTDENRREVWVYDKMSTETAYSTSSGGVAALVLAGAAPVGGGAGGSMEGSAGATSRSQRTLTVVIKFDENKAVRDFSYRYSSF